jgi:hypothetical protein
MGEICIIIALCAIVLLIGYGIWDTKDTPPAKTLWVIKVPNEVHGITVELEKHYEWDQKVRGIAGGLSIFDTIKGQWVAPDGKTIAEQMIPVSIYCTENEINEIADFTASFYKQKVIMFYEISNRVFFKDFSHVY